MQWTRATSLAITAACAAAIGLGLAPPATAKPNLELASRATGASGEKSDGVSEEPSISASGRVIAFTSTAKNLVSEDTDGQRDVYVRDLRANTTTLVSRATGPTGAKADGASSDASISADGRYVAFFSFARNLDPDVVVAGQVYVRDLVAETTQLVSRTSEGQAFPYQSRRPSISADGSRVAFEDPGRVYVRDLTDNTTTLASRASGEEGAISQNSSSYDPSLSADGERVAFTLLGSGFDPAHYPNSLAAVYVRDLESHTTTMVSRRSGIEGGYRGESDLPTISADGSRVGFQGPPSLDLVASGLLGTIAVRDLVTNETSVVNRKLKSPRGTERGGAGQPSISADGRLVALSMRFYDRGGPRAEPFSRVYLARVATGKATRVPGADGRRDDGLDLLPSLSGNGRWLAFQSRARHLAPGDGDAKQDIFVTRLAR